VVAGGGDAQGGEAVTEPEALLRLTGIRKRYGGVQALRGVDFDVRSGEVHALVGENGAGKSTLIKIISGAETADEGTVEMTGQRLGGGNTSAALDAGIATVYQEPQLFGELSVAENIFIGRELTRGVLVDRAAQLAKVDELLDRLGLDRALADVRVADIPVGEQQLVSIAKAFSHEPKILILDEPSAILTDREIDTLFQVVKGLREHDVGIIYISHRLDELSVIADRVTVLRDGEKVASHAMREVTIRKVVELMVGHVPVGPPTGHRVAAEVEPALEVSGLSRRGGFQDVSFAVRPSEVVAVYGLIGSGTGPLARALFGIDPADSGTIKVNGEPVRLPTPQAAARTGIALLPGNRKAQGVFGIKSIAFNISVAHLHLLRRLRVWVDRRREQQVATDLIKRIAIKAPGPHTPVNALSGGNQQKVVLARQLVERPGVLVLEEPTQGVDVGAKEEIHKQILALADQGTAVLVVSSDLLEVLELADRVLVVRAGSIVAEFGRGASQADVLAAAAGDESGEGTALDAARAAVAEEVETR
jgi:rhamnose transport system ATP-binding protein